MVPKTNVVMPCPSTGSKMLCAGPNSLSQSKHLIAFSASSKTFVAAQCKNQICLMEIIFWCATKCLGLTQNVYQFLVWPKLIKIPIHCNLLHKKVEYLQKVKIYILKIKLEF